MPSISVLRGPHPRVPLAKTIGGEGPKRKPKYWDSITRADLPYIMDLYLLISLDLEGDPYACMVPGMPGEPNAQGKWRRALQALPVNARKPEEGKDPAGVIAGAGASVLILDHDSGVYPGDTGRDTCLPELAEALVRHYCHLAGLRELVSGVVQFSGSHGVKGCRAKLFFLLESVQRWPWVRDYCKARLGCDESVTSPAQIIYTAAPVVAEGTEDPVRGAERTHLVQGSKARWPDIEDGDTDVEAWTKLHRACAILRDHPVGDPRHPVINRECWQVGRFVAADRLPRDTAVEWLERACVESPAIGPGRVDLREVTDAVDAGDKSPAAARDVVASLDRTSTGQIRPILGNAVALLDPVDITLNDFGDLEITKAPPWSMEKEIWPRKVDDGQILRASLWLHREHRVAFATREVMDAMKTKGVLNPVDRLTEYLDRVAELPEGRVTIDNVSVKAWYAKDIEAHHLGAAKFFIQCVRRAYEPGCKAELVLILHGAPGIGKTRSIRAFFVRPGDKYFVSSHIPISNQQLYAPILRGIWGAELAEQKSVSQYHADQFKTFLSLQSIKYRTPYDRVASEIMLRSNYVWSTEHDTPLSDPNVRRMVLIEVRQWAELTPEEIDAFWGSAVRAYRAGRPAWIDKEEAAVLEESREMALQTDSLQEAVEELLHYRDARDAAQAQVWVLNQLSANPKFGIKVSDASAKDRIGKIMARLKWKNKVERMKRKDGATFSRRVWTPPEGWHFYEMPAAMGDVLEFPNY